MSTLPVALTIAGSDCSGGAGVQADLKTFTALGVYGESCITAITAQNTRGVTAIHDVPAGMVRAQLDAVFTDIRPDAVKIGMVSSAAIICEIADALARYQPAHVVVDPVMVASSGAKLLSPQAADALAETLLPLATLITPNLPEAEALTGRRVRMKDDMPEAACEIAARTGSAVLLKGGHLARTRDDFLLQDGQGHWLHGEPVLTGNTHGTGCTLSSAIAAGLACGQGLESAVCAAKAYVTQALRWGLDLGAGSGPLCHMARLLEPQ